LGRDEQQPAIACLTAAIAFSLWHTYSDPKFYLEHLVGPRSLSGDTVVDAELYRGAVNILLVMLLIGMIKFVFRRSLSEFGLGLGNWRKAPFLVAATPLMLAFGYLGANMKEYHDFYPATPGLAERSMAVFALHVGVLITYYIGWELLFRGVIQTSMMPRLGVAGAIAVQTLASTLAHTARPASELIGSIAAGIIWGIFAYRTKSIWPVFVHHVLLGVTVDYWICFGGVS